MADKTRVFVREVAHPGKARWGKRQTGAQLAIFEFFGKRERCYSVLAHAKDRNILALGVSRSLRSDLPISRDDGRFVRFTRAVLR